MASLQNGYWILVLAFVFECVTVINIAGKVGAVSTPSSRLSKELLLTKPEKDAFDKVFLKIILNFLRGRRGNKYCFKTV